MRSLAFNDRAEWRQSLNGGHVLQTNSGLKATRPTDAILSQIPEMFGRSQDCTTKSCLVGIIYRPAIALDRATT